MLIQGGKFMKVIGVDIGGTSIKLGLVNEKGEIDQFQEYDTESQKGGPYVLNTLVEKIRNEFAGFSAIGVSTLGQIDRENGVIMQEASNVPQTKGLQIKRTLEDAFNVPVSVENDVNAAALGESAFGIGANYSDLLYIAYGTGVGGAIVIDSNIYYGKSGYAGEFGHFPTHAFGKPCGCGQLGCYEKYASTTALVEAAQEVDATLTNGRIIFEKYHAGDQAVEKIVNDWLKEIAVGLVSVVHIFNPSTIVLGGGVMEQEVILNKLQQLVESYTLESFHGFEILSATLGNRAGLLGAASLHLNKN